MLTAAAAKLERLCIAEPTKTHFHPSYFKLSLLDFSVIFDKVTFIHFNLLVELTS